MWTQIVGQLYFAADQTAKGTVRMGIKGASDLERARALRTGENR